MVVCLDLCGLRGGGLGCGVRGGSRRTRLRIGCIERGDHLSRRDHVARVDVEIPQDTGRARHDVLRQIGRDCAGRVNHAVTAPHRDGRECNRCGRGATNARHGGRIHRRRGVLRLHDRESDNDDHGTEHDRDRERPTVAAHKHDEDRADEDRRKSDRCVFPGIGIAVGGRHTGHRACADVRSAYREPIDSRAVDTAREANCDRPGHRHPERCVERPLVRSGAPCASERTVHGHRRHP